MTFAALFPGQGSHAVGMARDLFASSPSARVVLERSEEAVPGLLALMFDGPIEALTQTRNQQPALVAAGAAAYAAWIAAGGERPAVTAGHSLGEYTALVAAEALHVEDAVRLVRARGTYMQDAVPEGIGAMAAILKLSDDVVTRLCREVPSDAGTAEIANLNAPGQVVVSGHAAAVADVAARAKAEGGRAVPLKVSAPFHCSLMQPAADRLARDLHATEFRDPSVPVVCNVTARVARDGDEARALLLEQVTAPVRWTDSVRAIAATGVDRFLEFGSGSVLTGLAARIVPGCRAASVHDEATLQAVLDAERPNTEGNDA